MATQSFVAWSNWLCIGSDIRNKTGNAHCENCCCDQIHLINTHWFSSRFHMHV